MATGIETFLMLKIIPVFQKMFEEFGLLLPTPTILTVRLANFFVHYGWVGFVPLSILAVLFVQGGVLYFLGWFPRGLLLWLPFRRYDGALIMRGLALDGPPRRASDRGIAAAGGDLSLQLDRAAVAHGPPARFAGGRLDRGPQAGAADRSSRRGGAACRRAGRQPALALEEMAETLCGDRCIACKSR